MKETDQSVEKINNMGSSIIFFSAVVYRDKWLELNRRTGYGVYVNRFAE